MKKQPPDLLLSVRHTCNTVTQGITCVPQTLTISLYFFCFSFHSTNIVLIMMGVTTVSTRRYSSCIMPNTRPYLLIKLLMSSVRDLVREKFQQAM